MSAPETRQRILVVDDERVNRSVLSELLKGEHQVLLAKSGDQALEHLSRDCGIDLILLDVMMPDMDGYQVLQRLKENDRTREIPVMFITALNTVGDEERGLNLGACDYIGKPFSPAIVRARVANLLRFVRQRKLLETLAGRDGLTEIPNRRAFDELLDREWRRSQRNGQPFSLGMIDVDHFKLYNDHYGHTNGDHVLRSVANALMGSLNRPADFVARYGGEEFVFILPDTDQFGGHEIAHRIRGTVQALSIAHERSPVALHVTVSIGGATAFVSEDSPLKLIEAADDALYKAKHAGRNQVVWS